MSLGKQTIHVSCFETNASHAPSQTSPCSLLSMCKYSSRSSVKFALCCSCFSISVKYAHSPVKGAWVAASECISSPLFRVDHEACPVASHISYVWLLTVDRHWRSLGISARLWSAIVAQEDGAACWYGGGCTGLLGRLCGGLSKGDWSVSWTRSVTEKEVGGIRKIGLTFPQWQA